MSNLELQVLYILIFSSMVGVVTAHYYPDSQMFDPDILLILGLVLYIDFVWLLMVVYI